MRPVRSLVQRESTRFDSQLFPGLKYSKYIPVAPAKEHALLLTCPFSAFLSSAVNSGAR